jgi:hypothetical protein
MTLQPQHSSTLNNSIKPKGMDVTKIPTDARRFVEAEALSIFTTMTNSGASLQQALTAIFLSGMSAAHGIKEST